MSEYQKILGKALPSNMLLLPLQYKSFNITHQITLFLELGQEIVNGVSNRLNEALVVELLGRVPFPEIFSLKGKKIILYRPGEDQNRFLADMQQMISLPQIPTQNVDIKGNIVKIRGHSLFQKDEENSNKLSQYYDPTRFVNIIYKSIQSIAVAQKIEPIVEEILSQNQIIDKPFMITEFLPVSIFQGFSTLNADILNKNIFQLIYLISGYAQNGIYFKEICPEHFRFTSNGILRLIVTSYFTREFSSENRYSLFLKQVIPEYLPNLVTWYLRNNQQPKILQYFEKFPEGICIGMLERVLRRVFLPEYMSAKYDAIPNNSTNFAVRLNQVIASQWQEDLELFHSPISEIPDSKQFKRYQTTLADLLQNKGYSIDISNKISKVLLVLRQFSYPIYLNEASCQSLLKDGENSLSINSLSQYISSILNINENNLQNNLTEKPQEISETKKIPGTTTARKNNPLFGTSALKAVGNETRRLQTSKESIKKMVQIPVISYPFSGQPLSQSVSLQQQQQQLPSQVQAAQIAQYPVSNSSQSFQQQQQPPTQITQYPYPPQISPQFFQQQQQPPTQITQYPYQSQTQPQFFQQQQQPPTQITQYPYQSQTQPQFFQQQQQSPPAQIPQYPSSPQTSYYQQQQPQSSYQIQPKSPDSKNLPTTTINLKSHPVVISSPFEEIKKIAESEKNLKTARLEQITRHSKIAATKVFSQLPRTNSLKLPETETNTCLVVTESDKISFNMAQELMDLIAKKLSKIQELIVDDSRFAERFRIRIFKLLSSGTTFNSLEDFLANSNLLLQSQDFEFDLLRIAQAVIPEDIIIRIIENASEDIKSIFTNNNITWAKRCRRLLIANITRIIKTRFLLEADKIVDINNLLPLLEEDILDYIFKYDVKNNYFSKMELSNSVLLEIDKMDQR